MTTEVLAQQLTANVQATFGAGRVFYVKTAAGPLTITAEKVGSGGQIRKFSNVTTGFKFNGSADADGWTYLRVLSATTQNVELVIGDDDVTLSNAVSVSGTVTTVTNPSATLTASAADSVITNATALAIGANLSRRRVTIGALSTNTGSVRVQSTGAGANRGVELQPGTFLELDTTSAFDVRNDSGASQTVYVLEES